MRVFLLMLMVSVFSLFSANKALLDGSKVTGYRIQSNTDSYLDINFNVKDINFEDITTEKGIFTSVSIDKGYLTMEIGLPALPSFHELISMPYGAEPTVEVISYDSKVYKLSEFGIENRIAPAQPSYAKNSKPEDRKFIYKESVYLSSKFSGDPIATITKSGTMRGVGVGALQVNPFRYNPVEETIEVLNNLRVRVNYVNTDPRSEQIKAESYSPYFESAYNQLINYKLSTTKSDLMTYPITYLILANDNLNGNSDLQRLIDWKTEKGFNVIVNYVSASSSINTNDTWVENQWSTLTPKPSFILVVGDADGTYAVQAELDPSLGAGGSVSATDLIYGVIGATSSSNRIPSMYGGRMSVRTPSDLTAQVDKTIWYEKEQFLVGTPDLDYLTAPMGTAGYDSNYGQNFGNPQIYYGWTYYFTAANGMANAVSHYYPDTGNSAVDQEIIDHISAGCNFYNYTAHGCNTGMQDPEFYGVNTYGKPNDISGLTNANKYPLIVGNCCLTGSYGNNSSTSSSFGGYDYCFGEQLLVAADKGGVGYIGSSMSTYWNEDLAMGVGEDVNGQSAPPKDISNPGMYDGVMELGYSSQAAMRHVGLMAVENYGGSKVDWYWCAYQMFGDPSVQIYFGIPSTMTASHSGSIDPSDVSYSISTDPYAYVALSDQSGVLHGAARANSSGNATVTITSYSEGDTAKLVITNQFKRPYFEDISVSGGTPLPPETLPFNENFNTSTSLPIGWQIIDNQGSGQVWQFGTHTSGLSGADGYYAYLNSDAYGSGNTQNTDLVTPLIDMTGASNVSLAFSHYFRYYDPSTATLSYSINGGSSWTAIQSWTSTDTANPVAFNQVIAAVAGQSEVKFKWNYTGTWGYSWDIDDISITTDTPVIPPFASTLSASSITTNSATLSGSVNANDESTTVTFEYGLTTGYGSTISAVPGAVTGSTNTSVSADISGLSESTTYNFRVKAVNSGGTTYGSNQAFVTDDPASDVNPPTNLVANVNESDVSLSWTAPESAVEPDTMADGFETYSDFALSFSPWTQIDNDGSATYGIQDVAFTNQNYTGAYIVFNPSQADPALTDAKWQPKTGNKYAACFAAQTPANDDWLISPELLIGSGYSLSFYAKSVTDQYGLERFKVGVSTTGTSTGDFTIISSGSYIEPPLDWTNYSYDLSAYSGQTVYLAIICISNDAFTFMVDDIIVDNSKGDAIFVQDFETQPKTNSNKPYYKSRYEGNNSPIAKINISDIDIERASKSSLTGYKVYRDGGVIATIADPFAVTYSDTDLSNGDYSYYVTATYSDPVEESTATNTENVVVSTQFVIDTYPWEESFEGTLFAPENWDTQSVSTNTWESTTGYTIGESTIVAQEGSKFSYVNWIAEYQNEWLITPLFDLSLISSPELSFWFHGNYEWAVTNPNCMLKIMQRTNGGAWSEIWRATDHNSFDSGYPSYSWLETTLPLDGYTKGFIQFAFVYTGNDGAKFGVDNIVVDGELVVDKMVSVNPDTGEVEVHLSWDSVYGATIYHIYRSTDPYSGFGIIGSTPSNGYIDYDTVGSNMYFYYLTADDAKR